MPVVDGQRGRAFDLRDRTGGRDRADAPDVVAADVAAAIRGESAPIEIRCAEPGPVHDRVGVIRPDREYPLRSALAAAARALGRAPPQQEALVEVRERLQELDPPDHSLEAARRRVAETEDAAALEERVAELRGQLEAARERGDDPSELEEATERAVADLADRRTERLAAEQALERAREAARAARDRREERLRLEDRERNLEREARAALARSLADSFERALRSVPGDGARDREAGAVAGAIGAAADGVDAATDGVGGAAGDVGAATDERPWDVADQVAGALAVCRLAPIAAPVVVAVDRFPSARAAAAALDAPVVLVGD